MWILAYFLLHVAVYTVVRFGFLVWNWSGLEFHSSTEILSAFWYGLRFDLSSIAATSFIFFIGLFWLERFRLPKILWFGFFWLLNIALILFNCADIELVNFTARRFTKGSLFLLGEGQIINVIMPYLGIALFALTVIGSYSYASYIIYRNTRIRQHFALKAALSFLTLLIAVVLFRGGLQSKPVMVVDGRFFANPLANQMVLNSTFTLMKSLDKPTVERVRYFDQAEMLGYLNQPTAYSTITAPLPRANIVIVVLESFSKEYTELRNPEFTPFLNQLAKKGAYFPHFYANSKTSIAGVPAILAGVPALMDDPFIDSEFSLNHYLGLPSLLAQQGYHTSFFHGANKNSMHFDAFAKGAGFQYHFAREDYPNKTDDDEKWGIYDGPFLNWICEKYSTFHEPFMSSFFTLSSHQPYSIPEAERSKHPDGSHPILKSIHYSDASLEQFMKCAAGQKWFKNTLFLFTADHTGPRLKVDTSFAAQFEVPLIIYTENPTILKGMDTQQFAQHIDILPTLLETIGVEQNSVNHLARSLWHPGRKVVPLYLDGTYQLVGLPADASEQLRTDTQRAVWQYFSEGMLDDQLYIKPKRQ